MRYDVDGMSDKLKKKLIKWDNLGQFNYNKDDPRESGFTNIQELISFEKQGIKIWKEIIREVGNKYHFTYDSILFGKEFNNPEVYSQYYEKNIKEILKKKRHDYLKSNK